MTKSDNGCIMCSMEKNMKKVKINLDTLIARKMLDAGRSITVKEVSDGTGISENRLIEFRKDRARAIRFDTILALCGYFDCAIADLMTIV